MSSNADAVKEALAGLGKVAEPILVLAKIKASAPDAVEDVEKALRRLPAGEPFGRALDEAREVLERAIEETRRERVQAFKRVEADFVRTAQGAQKPMRELSHGWRIGMLELEFKREHAQARVRYNHEPLVDWVVIAKKEDLEKLESRATGMLDGAAFPDPMLTTVFWDAYVQERSRRSAEGKQRPDHVPILDFYREVRATLVRFELAGQKPDKRLQYADLPRWRFLYNLDRFRALGTNVPDSRRLGLETGSQQEVAKGLGLSVNGLDARQDYKTMCYVVAATRAVP